MPKYAQVDRPLALTTPLGKDVLLPIGFKGHEASSRLFNFQLDLLAESNSPILFDRILGQSVTVEIRLLNGDIRYFNGLVKRFSQGGRDDNDFLHYRAEVVPELWLLTKKVRCRVFQHFSVPEILHQVLSGLDVAFQIAGTYFQRDYCVQYRESDFDFASRLMEEEGIYYFFKHSNGNHQMVVTDTAAPTLTGQSSVIYEEASGEVREDMRVTAWEKAQELRAGEYTLWDHCFELPGNHLEAKQKPVESVTVGKVIHKLTVGGNDQLEIYDYPGGYAQRFDGIDRHGAPQPPNLQHIFEDRDRTVKIRMEQEQAASLEIHGAGDCGQFTAGHKFTLQRHFDADGQYLLTRVEHDARMGGNYRTDNTLPFSYENRFTCIPADLRYRAPGVTPKPVIAGMQTATVVGPQGQEIFCDKYGRVKVQFHWDREGKKDADSSCWLRVAQVWAGKGWGAFFWPRIGHEVVVIFEEGDPDQPLIVGSVYNKENMPWYSLTNKQGCWPASNRPACAARRENYNGILFNDEKGHEHLSIHSERHLVLHAELDKSFQAGRHQGERVAGARTVTVGRLPGTGGSGGGPNKKLWPHPEPSATLGINSSVVYGGNFQVAFPINFQLAFGSNLQICVNPSSLATLFTEGDILPASPTTAQFLGSGLGGNMQLTLGASTNFVMGQSVDINMGPRRIQIDVRDITSTQPAAKKLGKIIAAVTTAFLLVYLLPDDDWRALMMLTFQVTIQVLLELLMDFQDFYHIQTEWGRHTYNEVFKPVTKDDQTLDSKTPFWSDFSKASAFLELVVAEPLLESIGEKFGQED